MIFRAGSKILPLRPAQEINHWRSQMLNRFKTSKHSPHRIEVVVDRLEQLFNSMDPSPFPEKDLDDDAEEFIISWAQEFPRKDPISLLVHVNELPAIQDIQRSVETSVHHYFAYRAKLNQLEFRQLLRRGRLSLIIGLAFLSACLVTSELLLRQSESTLATVLRESLTIGGWVAMWRPMEIFLYEWWPLRRMGRLFEKLSHMHVEVRKRARK
jgi:hypothetical protein